MNAPFARKRMANIELLYLATGVWCSLICNVPVVGTNNGKPEICQTGECVEKAKFILASIDNSSDPCDDFYSFACGGILKQDFISHYEALHLKTMKVCQDLLEAVPVKNEAVTATDKAGLLYQKCTSGALHEDEVLVAVKAILAEEGLGQWPILQKNTSPTRFGNLESLALRTGIRSFGTLGVQQSSDGGRYILFEPFTQPPSSLDKIGLHSTHAAMEILKLPVKMIMPQTTSEQLDKYARSLLDFNHGYFKNITGNLSTDVSNVTIEELERFIPGFPVLKLLNDEFGKVNITLDKNQRILVSRLQSFERLVDYYRKDLEGAFNAMGAGEAQKYLSSYSREYCASVENILGFPYWKPISSGPRNCYYLLKMLMPEVVSRLYVVTKFCNDTKHQARHLLNSIAKTYFDQLELLPWLDNSTRIAARHKLWNMQPVVGYPDFLLSEDFVDNLYEKVGTLKQNTSMPVIIHRLQENAFFRALSRLRTKEKDRIIAHSNELNVEDISAIYVKTDNVIMFPAALLQAPFFQVDLPRYVSLGAMGTLMAQKLTHAFDFRGVLLDENGTWATVATNRSIVRFRKIADCFTRQYSNLTDPLAKMMLRGRSTLKEDIADNGGVGIAFKAHTMDSEHQPAIALAGLERFTPDQLFFLSYATTLCHAECVDINAETISSDAQSAARYRVNVPLQNMEQFSEAFQCKNGSRMRLPDEERCIAF